MQEVVKPAPRINSINRPFFDGCNADRLMLQRCTRPDCRRHVYFPRICCPYCAGGELEWVEAAGHGEIVTFTIVRRPNHPAYFPEAPYYFIAVRLAEGPLMYSRLDEPVDVEADLVGRRVHAVFVPLNDKQALPHFRLSE